MIGDMSAVFCVVTLPETNSSHPKMVGWNTIVSFWGPAYFQVQAVSFRECIYWYNHSSKSGVSQGAARRIMKDPSIEGECVQHVFHSRVSQ